MQKTSGIIMILANSLECWQMPKEKKALSQTYARKHCCHLNQIIKMKNKTLQAFFMAAA